MAPLPYHPAGDTVRPDAMNSRDAVKALEQDGWRLDRVRGSHHVFRHPSKPGTVTVPHPRKDLPAGTVRAIEQQSGVPLRRR